MKAPIARHPLAIAFEEILNLRFALEHGAIDEKERRELCEKLTQLESQAKKN